MKVLVAGGRGFIGARAVSAAAAAGHEAGILEHGDDAAAVCGAGWDALVCAALGHLPSLTRVVYLSSGETYGAQDVPFVEDAPLLGTSPYALAKIEGERALTSACASRGVDLTILRPSVVHGPGQRGPMFLPSLEHALAHDERFAMTAGEQTRDLVHVDDVAAAIVLALTGPAGTYNISSGTELTLRDLALTIATRAGKPHLLAIGALPYRPNEQMRYLLSPARASTTLGWKGTRSPLSTS
ncbi:MAG: NAD(P)-dependent oxidoreductase [Deltaproteobacteria bacterium]|nr:NAD(P)-dependent oxidoreductase [Kofleriaceae bacterium]